MGGPAHSAPDGGPRRGAQVQVVDWTKYCCLPLAPEVRNDRAGRAAALISSPGSRRPRTAAAPTAAGAAAQGPPGPRGTSQLPAGRDGRSAAASGGSPGGLRARPAGPGAQRWRGGGRARPAGLLALLNRRAGGRPGGGGGGEEGGEREAAEGLGALCPRLLPPRRQPPAPSSSRSLESCRVQPGLVEPPLLAALVRPQPAQAERAPAPRAQAAARGGRRAGRGPRTNAGGPSPRRGLSLRVRLSSSVVCRLPAELLRLTSSV